MHCTIAGCPGTYELRTIAQSFRQDGHIVVIDGIPAEVCSLCGDVLLAPDTVRRIERLLQSGATPSRTVPLYEYV